MRYKKFEDTIVVRLETGDDMHCSVREICKAEQVTMGTVLGFGGANYLKLGIWNNENNDYDYLVEDKCHMELLNATGNISLLDGDVHTHIHVTASDNKFRVFGGHLVKGVVQNLMEIYIYIGEGRINRMLVGNWYFMDI